MTDNLDAMEKMAWIDLVGKSNRTSPEEAPQMALISEEELGGYIRDAIATLRQQIAEATADRDEVARHRDVLHKQLAEAHAERDDYKKTAWEYHNDCARLRAEVKQWKARAEQFQRERAELSDKLNGTPCAQIRWQEELNILREALGALVNAKALSEVRQIVAGWNGEHLPPEKRYGRHPSNLGASIKTNCGRVYELDELMKKARTAIGDDQ